jgi:hypothetical protein
MSKTAMCRDDRCIHGNLELRTYNVELRNWVQAARKPNSVLDDHSSRRGVTDALSSNLPAGFDSGFLPSLRLAATGRCVISPEEGR